MKYLLLLLLIPVFGLFLFLTFLLWAAYLTALPPEEMFS